MTLTRVALGMLAAGLLTRFMQDLLFGTAPLDVVAFTLAPAVLIVAAKSEMKNPGEKCSLLTSDL